jgi:hypothetical protein
MGGQQKSQWNGKRQHPLAYRHLWDDVIHQVGGRLCHAPGAAGGTNSASLTGEGHELLVGAVCAAQSQKTMGQDAALKRSGTRMYRLRTEGWKGLELVFDELGQASPGLGLDLGKKALGMFLYQLVENRFLGPPPLVVYAVARLCGGRCRLNRLFHRP